MCPSTPVAPTTTALRSRSERDPIPKPSRRGRVDDSGGEAEGGKKLYYHLTALAENATGYKNLIQLSSRAFMEGYYYKPRVDWELLETHSEGLVALPPGVITVIFPVVALTGTTTPSIVAVGTEARAA